jgi:predicted peptidase
MSFVFILTLLFINTAFAWPCKSVPSNKAYSYCVHTPDRYDKKIKWPLLVFLSGSGARGSLKDASTVSTYSGVGHVLDQQVRGKSSGAGKTILQNFITVFVVAPISTVHFDPKAVAAAVKAATRDYSADTDRIYLTGYSSSSLG